MADKTFFISNGNMSTLNDLGMAGRASELLFPLHLIDMVEMIKDYIFKDYTLFQILFSMAPALQTARIIDLRMGFCGALAGDKISQGKLTIPPLSLQMVDEPRLVVTFDTSNFFVL